MIISRRSYVILTQKCPEIFIVLSFCFSFMLRITFLIPRGRHRDEGIEGGGAGEDKNRGRKMNVQYTLVAHKETCQCH